MYLVHGLVFLFNLVFVRALFIDWCPFWGCRPSGSFSFYLKVSHQNATVNWVSSHFAFVGTIFVSLPPPYLSSRNDLRSFWIFEDKNDTVQLVSRSDNLYVTHMSTWEPDSDWIQYDARKTMTSYIWATTIDSMLIQINADGSLSKSIDLRNLLGDTTRETIKNRSYERHGRV